LLDSVLQEDINHQDSLKKKLIPDEKNYKLILQKKIDLSETKKVEQNKVLKLVQATEKLDKFYLNFYSELIKNLFILTEKFFTKEEINIEKSSKLKALEYEKNEISKIESSEVSIINTLINTKNDKKIFTEEKTKEVDSYIKENEIKIKQIESENTLVEESIKNSLYQLDKISKDIKIIVENVKFFFILLKIFNDR